MSFCEFLCTFSSEYILLPTHISSTPLSSHRYHAPFHITKGTLMGEYTTRDNVVHNDPKSDFHPISFLNHIGGCLLSCEHNNPILKISLSPKIHPSITPSLKACCKYSYTISLFPILIFMNTSIGIKHHIISYPIPSLHPSNPFPSLQVPLGSTTTSYHLP